MGALCGSAFQIIGLAYNALGALFTCLAHSAYHNLNLTGRISLGQGDIGDAYLFEAKGIAALFADEVNMPIMMMAFFAFVLA